MRKEEEGKKREETVGKFTEKLAWIESGRTIIKLYCAYQNHGKSLGRNSVSRIWRDFIHRNVNPGPKSTYRNSSFGCHGWKVEIDYRERSRDN